MARVTKQGIWKATSQVVLSGTYEDEAASTVIQTVDHLRNLAAIATSLRTTIKNHAQVEPGSDPSGPQGDAVGHADGGSAPHTGTGGNTSVEKEEP